MRSLTQALGFTAFTAVLSYVAVRWFASWAERRELLDVANVRSSHVHPTPRGAGVVIVAVTLAGAWIAQALLNPGQSWVPLAAFTVGGLLIATVSWRDDVSGVAVEVRLAAHVLSAAIAIWGIGYWREVDLPVAGTVQLGVAGIVLTALWIVGLINAVNFMDGIDGIAGTQAAIAASGWAILGAMTGQSLVVVVALLLAAGSTGFLINNWPPARVFMGDVGSAFLGYSLAVLPFFAAPLPAWSPAVAALLMWPFVLDSGGTFVVRLARGENVFAPHRSHLYQRLAETRDAHQSVTLLYGGLALGGAAIALAWVASLES